MFPVVLAVEAPTTAIWFTLLRYYLFLGFAAGAIVVVWMLYFVVKYRERKDVKSAPVYHHEEETGWGNWKTVVLTLLITGGVLAFVEYETFASTGLIVPPVTNGDPVYINVTGQQFQWSFTYSNGYTSIGNLTVPVNQIVILNITSIDVDHSFSILSLNVAKDALPGIHNFVWFNATQTGFFKDDIRCKELCGVGHALMIADFNVTTAAGFNAFLAAHAPSTAHTTSTSITGPTQTVYLPLGAGGPQQLNFSPATLTVAAGTTITFVDQDTYAPHDVYFTSVPAGASVPTNPSPVLTNGDTFTVTLTTPGTYHYECQFHPLWMQATIVVTG
ncbi:MAG: cupredoxin domain-containing protein [Nitrososphaerota archaeon]|nr:cupredoxin domain-containing protein [Nitrososphaerota archaeon]